MKLHHIKEMMIHSIKKGDVMVVKLPSSPSQCDMRRMRDQIMSITKDCGLVDVIFVDKNTDIEFIRSEENDHS